MTVVEPGQLWRCTDVDLDGERTVMLYVIVSVEDGQVGWLRVAPVLGRVLRCSLESFRHEVRDGQGRIQRRSVLVSPAPPRARPRPGVDQSRAYPRVPL